MQNRLGKFVLAIIISTTLSGCLVEKKKPEEITTISRTTDILHIYQPNEFIDYNVLATVIDGSSVTTASGTLRVLWESHTDLSDPIDSDIQYPVLKETTTLSYNTGNEPDATVIRYISQDATGSITLHAIENSDNLYWPRAVGITNPSAPVTTPVIFGSPLSVGVDPLPTSPVEFFVMAGCDTGSCSDELYKFSDSFSVDGDTREVTTNLGVFKNPFELSFNGGIVDSVSGLAVSVLGDIRDACGTSNETINHGTSAGSGKIYVMPEIGIIQMENVCQIIIGSAKTVQYTFTLDNTNISLP